MTDRNNKPLFIAIESIGASSLDGVDKGECIRSVIKTAENSIKEHEGYTYIDVYGKDGGRYLRTDYPDTNFYTATADLFASILMLHKKNVEQDNENQELKEKIGDQKKKIDILEENLKVLREEIYEKFQRLD